MSLFQRNDLVQIPVLSELCCIFWKYRQMLLSAQFYLTVAFYTMCFRRKLYIVMLLLCAKYSDDVETNSVNFGRQRLNFKRTRLVARKLVT